MNLMQNAFLEQSFRFAQFVDREMKGGAIKNSRGISQDPFYVLWRTAMPAVLVECGFMSNPADREVLITEKGRDKIASDLFDAFKAYKKEYDGSVTTTVREQTPEADTIKVEPSAPVVEGDIFYGTQVLVSSKEMKQGDPFFKGNEFKSSRNGKLFKYYVGCSNNLDEAKANYELLKKSFPDSFLVKVENGISARFQ